MTYCLVVDDSRIDRTHNVSICKSIGLEVLEASSVKEALKLCDEALPEVIILDLIMPNENGIDFLRKCRTIYAAKNIFIILCSSSDAKEDRLQALKHHADDYIVKPLTVEKLESSLSGIMSA